jgi:hypothetical protein
MNTDCISGVCLSSGGCSDPAETDTIAQGQQCDYSEQCTGDLICVDDGSYKPTFTCQLKTVRRARACQLGVDDTCDEDTDYETCGASRNPDETTGVCGGQGAICQGKSFISTWVPRV